MKILALDIGSHTGVMGTGMERPQTWEFEGTREEKFWNFYSVLGGTLVQARLHGGYYDAIVYERPFNRGLDATRSLWGYAGIIEMSSASTSWGAACLDVPNTMLKKWALGKCPPTRNKLPMIELAATMGYPDLNEHEADALLLYEFAKAHILVGEK